MMTPIQVITDDERFVIRYADVAYLTMVGSVFGTDGKVYYLAGENDNGWIFAEVKNDRV
jgi:hypothetical protein